MPTALVTGASRGLGLEFVRQYAEAGWTVVAGCRDPARAEALERLEGDVLVAALDVTDPASVAILAERLRGLPIDLLVNNAGVFGPRRPHLGAVDFAAWEEVLRTNAMAPVRVSEAFLDHLKQAAPSRIAVVSSRMGSIGESTGGNLIYRSSKAAVNAAMKAVALEVASSGISVLMLHPGWVRTDMGGPSATIDAATSVAAMRRLVDGAAAAMTGRFWNHDGEEIAW